GYSRLDIVRFVNEVMERASLGDGPVADDEPPRLVDPEDGLPDQDAIHEILEFELGRSAQDRRAEGPLVVALEMLLPGWAGGLAHKRAHELLSISFAAQLRTRDSLGRLTGSRYLLILPHAKDGTIRALEGRLSSLLRDRREGLPSDLAV